MAAERVKSQARRARLTLAPGGDNHPAPSVDAWVRAGGEHDGVAGPEEPKEPTRRLTADIPESIHRAFCAAAALQGRTNRDVLIELMQQYVEQRRAAGAG